MANRTQIIRRRVIEDSIHLIRGQKVMLDSDLAAIYGVELKRLNEQVRRNRQRFPRDFAFQLSRSEFENLKSQFATSSSHGGKRKLPWVFTEHGAIMLATVLSTPIAVDASIRVVRAFVRMRELLSLNSELSGKLAELESRVEGHDEAIQKLFDVIRKLITAPQPEAPRRQIGFHIQEDTVPYRIRRRNSH